MAILPVGIGPQEGGYQIERSLRFNSADTADLNRTFSTPTDNNRCTFSLWVKKTTNSAGPLDFGFLTTGVNTSVVGISGTGAYGASLDNKIFIRNNDTNKDYWYPVLRDNSAWYHIVIAINTDESTQANRAKLWINGVSQADNKQASNFSLSEALTFNTASTVHRIGSIGTSYPTYYSNGYLTEYHFIDGQALDASYFGEANTDTGVWQPKAYTGSYGTNGFYLDFADNSSTTALGYDAAGSNDWTPNNFSVTAGSGNDSLVDTPTPYGTDTGVGGEVRGNYCTLNPLNVTNAPTLSNGNLDFAGSTSNASATTGTIGISSGKWYWEVLVTNTSALGIGIFNATVAPSLSTIYDYENDGRKRTGGVASSYGASFTTNDIIGVALDLDGGTLVFYKNNTSQGTAFSGLAGTLFVAGILDVDNVPSATCSINFGQRPFAYTAPSGFKALCTQNLPEPTVKDGGDYFNAVTYSGTGSNQAITVGFQPDFIWTKSRSNSTNGYDHGLWDVIRGFAGDKALCTNGTEAEGFTAAGSTTSQFGNPTSITSTGYTVTAGTTNSKLVNETSNGYVAWNWKAGGTGVSNTDGSITSTVSANPTAGFSVVKTTGTGTAGTIGHGLGVAPRFIFGRNYSDAGGSNWPVYHASVGANNIGWINLTNAFTTSAATAYWNDTAPTSSVFSVGTNSNTNQSGASHIFYCFAPVEGYSAFGSYTGNGNDDGTFVYTGFKPAFVLIKCSSTSSTFTSWSMFDTSRSSYNVSAGNTLYANSSINEGYRGNGSTASTTSPAIDLLSNGFKLRKNADETNASQTYIYAAFAEVPFKLALGR